MIQEIQSCFEVKTEIEVAFKIELEKEENELLYQLRVKCHENETKYRGYKPK